MSQLEAHHREILQKILETQFVAELPSLLDARKPPDEQKRKNLSRAFSAFALHKLCEITPQVAAKSVVDDFDDCGIDAIYYHAPNETLYFVQSKLKATETFKQEDALAFCQGIRKLLQSDFDSFNQHVQRRQTEIEGALDQCSYIQLIIAHTTEISAHASQALKELFDEDHGEERLIKQVIEYDSPTIVEDLRSAKAYKKVNDDLFLERYEKVEEPRETYFGLAKLEELVALHKKYEKALYEKNIRTFLGHKTDVNASIQKTLATKPQDFFYLNNGITALCQEIHPKGKQKGRRRFTLKGVSVINGAQTIASAAKFLADNQDADISAAKVSVTLIKATADGDFGKAVTQARNHQNPVLLSHFAALDDEQERLRREIAYLGIQYSYKAESQDGHNDPSYIRIEEAAHALALMQFDPRFVVWLKKEPSRLLDTGTEQYKSIFTDKLTGFQLVNAVYFCRYVQRRILTEERSASGPERLAYKHGNYAVAWVLAKRLRVASEKPRVFQDAKLSRSLSEPFDKLRQIHWDKTDTRTYLKGPLAIFRNQADTIPILRDVLIEYFELSSDSVVEHKQREQQAGIAYPKPLFDYLISKAPQIEDVA